MNNIKLIGLIGLSIFISFIQFGPVTLAGQGPCCFR
jgi:hypothetical protein